MRRQSPSLSLQTTAPTTTTTIPTTTMMSVSDPYDLRAKYTYFRILVIGRANAGKNDAPAMSLTQPRILVSSKTITTWRVFIDLKIDSASDIFN